MQLIFHHYFPYDFDRFCCVLAEIVTCHFPTHCLGTGKNSLKDKDKKEIKIKKLCLTSRFETVNISSVELLLGHNK